MIIIVIFGVTKVDHKHYYSAGSYHVFHINNCLNYTKV